MRIQHPDVLRAFAYAQRVEPCVVLELYREDGKVTFTVVTEKGDQVRRHCVKATALKACEVLCKMARFLPLGGNPLNQGGDPHISIFYTLYQNRLREAGFTPLKTMHVETVWGSPQ